MLNKIEIMNNQGDTLVLPLQDVVEGYVVQDIEGLDPVPAVIVTSGFAQQDGEQYQSSRRSKRNIVLTLGLEAALYARGTVKDLRNNLYRWLMPKSEARFRFFDTDGSFVEIYGRVEDFESKLFVKDPVAAITIVCVKPDFYIPEPVVINALTVSNSSEFVINYQGTVDTGFIMRFNIDRNVNGITVYHHLTEGAINTLEFTGTLASGDVLSISTVPGAKGATLNRANSDSPILYGVSPSSKWLALDQGDNYIRAYTEGAPVPFTIEYTTKIGAL